MKNSIAFLALMISVSFGLKAQQAWQLTQYVQNEYLLNPAFSGAKDMVDINMSYRQQWLGIEYSPSTYYISANARIFGERPRTKTTNLPTSKSANSSTKRKVTHGAGGLILRDKFGAFNQTLIAGSYAVHVPISKKWTLSAGLEASMKNFVFEYNQVKMENINDEAFASFYANTNQYVNSWEPNVDIGLVAKSDYAFIAYSTEQLLEGKLNFDNANLDPHLSRTHQVYAGGIFKLTPDIRLIPSTFIRINESAPFNYDVNVKLDYQDRFYASLGYRSQDAILLGAGIFVNDQIKIGYSYDKTISTLNLISSGSHEFFVGFELFKK